jgi:chemotaxis response regulator CheB
MPRAAFERGAVGHQCSLSHMANAILDACDAGAKPKPMENIASHAVRAG